MCHRQKGTMGKKRSHPTQAFKGKVHQKMKSQLLPTLLPMESQVKFYERF